MNTKKLIINAAFRLFSRHGYNETTMDAIAGEAGVAKGTLYWHFPSKEALFQKILNDSFETFFQNLESIQRQCKSKRETLLSIIHYYMEIFSAALQNLLNPSYTYSMSKFCSKSIISSI